MAQTVDEALKAAQLYTDNQSYRLLKLPARAVTAAAGVLAEIGAPFTALIVDKDEVTLVLYADAVSDFTRRLQGHTASEATYRLITFDVALEPTLTGFMARVSAALAGAGIPIVTFGAFSRDHLLVPADRFDQAWSVLSKLTGSETSG